MNLLNKIKNLIKIGTLLSTNKKADKNRYNVSVFGSEKISAILEPYGFISNAPEGSTVVLFQQTGLESNLIGIADDFKNKPKIGEDGEPVICNYSQPLSYILLKNNGDIDIQSLLGNFNLNSTKINFISTSFSVVSNIDIEGNLIINGNVTINGNITINGNLIVNGIDFSTHVHDKVTVGDAKTGLPQ